VRRVRPILVQGPRVRRQTRSCVKPRLFAADISFRESAMKTAPGRSVRSRRAISSDPTPAPSAYSRLVPRQIVNTESGESTAPTHRLGPRQSLLRLTLIRGYGHDEGARRFDALEQIRERLQLDDHRVRAVYSTLLLHVDAAIDRRLLQPLAAQRDAE